MATAELDKSAPASAGSAASPGWAQRMLQVHKPGEGTVTRLGLFLVLLGFVLYTCHHWWYNWQFLQKFLYARLFEPIHLGFLVDWMVQAHRAIQFGGAGVLGLAGAGVAYYYIYVKTRSAEFFVQTDTELKKVSWPKFEPWFRPETQVWGATYVVLIVVALLALYVFGVDFILNYLAHWAFYGGAG